MTPRSRSLFLAFVAELQDDCRNPDAKELSLRGRSSADILVQAANVLADVHSQTSQTSACAALGDLARHAHTAMASSTVQEAQKWRRVHTDACIILAYADVLDYMSSTDMRYARSAVAHLDHAIVISGAAGRGRLDLIFDLIEVIQAECLEAPLALRMNGSFSPKDCSSAVVSPRLSTAGTSVPRLDALPSLATFASRLSRNPFVLPGFLQDWPALKEHPWSSLDYLRAVAGPGRVVPVEVGSDYRSDDWSQRMMPWDDFIDELGPAHTAEPRQVLYLAQHSLFKQFTALRNDIIVPDYVYAALDAPDDYPQYVPPSNEEQLVLNAWLGPGGTVSPAHTDPFFNFYAQVVGRKTIWLAPPKASAHMYPYPPAPTSTSLQSPPGVPGEPPRNPAANHETPSMSNTTRVDVFLSSDEEASKSQSEFPDFWREVVPNAMSVTLEPGDLLFFPPGWWHAMKSEGMSFSVSMWF
ncbi:Clavaminate synthase-like protein [Trametes meyenii]|nr:Clavaminate synthase-like protein [Trametes meyenii]